MWQIEKPKPVKLIVGILATDEGCLAAAVAALEDRFGQVDHVSEVWPFYQTEYYRDQTGSSILRQFLSFDALIDPGELCRIKRTTNEMEEQLAKKLSKPVPRPVNLDPGLIEPSKLVLASTKNFSHRIYIGDGIYAELTLSYVKGKWQSYSYTFPDYKQPRYHGFLSTVRQKLVEQLRQLED